MAYEVSRTAQSNRDIDLIFDHLVSTYLSFDYTIDEAFDRASARVRQIQTDIEGLTHHPHQGTRRPQLANDLRFVVRNQAVLYIDIDEQHRSVRVLSIFLKGQDHLRHMTERLTNPTSGDA